MAASNRGSDGSVESDFLEFVLNFLDDDFVNIEEDEHVSIEEVLKLFYIISNCVAQKKRCHLWIWRFQFQLGLGSEIFHVENRSPSKCKKGETVEIHWKYVNQLQKLSS